MTGLNATYAIFENQFEEVGIDIYYRYRQKGAAYRVTQEERDAFVRRYKWSVRGGLTLGMIISFAILFPALNWSENAHLKPSGILVGGLLFVTLSSALMPFYFFYRKAMQYPLKTLESRPIVAPALSKEEVKRNFFHKLSYIQLAIVPFIPVAWLVPSRGHHDWINPMVGYARLWWLAVLACCALAGTQAYRKWKFEQNEKL